MLNPFTRHSLTQLLKTQNPKQIIPKSCPNSTTLKYPDPGRNPKPLALLIKTSTLPNIPTLYSIRKQHQKRTNIKSKNSEVAETHLHTSPTTIPTYIPYDIRTSKNPSQHLTDPREIEKTPSSDTYPKTQSYLYTPEKQP